MNLKDIAVPVDAFDGQVTLYWLPYSTAKTSAVMDEVSALRERKLSNADSIFVLCEGMLVAADLHEGATAHAKSIAYYLEQRNGSTAANLAAFNSAVSRNALKVLMDTYDATRDDDFKAEGGLADATSGDPLVKSAAVAL